MDKIRKNLYIGNYRAAHYKPALKKAKITTILNVAYEIDDPIYSVKDIICMKVGLADSTDNKQYVKQLSIDTLVTLLNKGETVLVHCSAGLSRSVFTACFALAELESKDPHDVFEEVQKIRPFAMKGGLWLGYGYKPLGYEEAN